MRAGRLRHWVNIKRLEAVKNPTTGVVTQTWETFADVWASVEPVSAREFALADQQQSRVMARILIRYIDGILPSMRVFYRDHIYKIEGVLSDRKSGIEYLTLPVSEVLRG